MNINNKTNSVRDEIKIQSDILIIDDFQTNIILLSKLLTKRGYNVRSACSGKEALAQIEIKPPQLILLDVMMPKMNGYQLCQKLKQTPVTAQIPIIFLSALENTKDKQKAFEVGGVDYISKPFKFEEVLMRVENQLKLQSAQNQIKCLNEELETRVKQSTTNLQEEIQQHKLTQKKLIQMAFYDTLTNLPNRVLLLNLLQNSIERSQHEAHYTYSVLFLDCDRFKLVNDSLGHLAGDQVLQQVARRLQSCLRPTDILARLGGDEFMVLLEDLPTVNYTTKIAQQLINKLKKPFRIKEREIFLGGSVGVLVDTKHYQSAETIVRDADMAMYRAKESGKACYRVFKSEMHQLAQQKLQLETDLRQALEKEEFVLHYQPIFSFTNNRIKGFEALVRWNHPTKGLLSPMNFINLAEETGLIVPLGMWVLKEACRQLQVWQQQNLIPGNLTMNVNLSVKQFAKSDLIQQIDQILAETKIDSQWLNLEITETAIMDNQELANNILCQIRERNIGLSIDDFGTGYSSLSYLHRFPVNQLKIDRSFVKTIMKKADSANIIETIMTLGKNLNMKIVAEGIENQAQFDRLRYLGCDFGQGYFFSKPLSSQSVYRFFDRHEQKTIA